MQKMFSLSIVSLLIFMTSAYAKTFLTIEEIIESSGFPVETHNVTTRDGFILSPVRIPAASTCNLTRVVAFLPGTSASGHVFVCNKPANFNLSIQPSDLCLAKIDKSTQFDNRLPFEFAQRCFDVWLLAYRGTAKGLKHISYKISEKRFWTWSLDEIVKFDLPATIDYIRLQTQKDKISLIGHSVGATMALLLAENRDYQQYLDALILLAPILPGNKEQFDLKHIILAVTTALLRNFNGPLMPQPWLYEYLKHICDKPLNSFPLLQPDLFIGKSNIKHYPSLACNHVHYTQTSIRSFNHANQIILSKSKRLHKYDFGLRKNIATYGQTKPPEYNIGGISLGDIVIFYGSNDPLVSEAAILNLVGLLKVKPRQVSSVEKFKHVDFVFAKEVGQTFNYRVLQAYQKIYCDFVQL